LANEKSDVHVALVTERYGSTTYRCQLNVRADSGIGTLEDLKDKVLCWLEPNSTSGHIIPRILLQDNGIDPDKDFAQTLEAGSHRDVIMAVYDGHCDVGASYADARTSIEADSPDVKDVVVVLATSADIPNDSISFTKDFPAEVREQIVNALLEASATEEGRAALEALYGISTLVKADDSIYDGFRADLENAGIEIESLVE
jgi:phosphonate transport system substrate-binding protein